MPKNKAPFSIKYEGERPWNYFQYPTSLNYMVSLYFDNKLTYHRKEDLKQRIKNRILYLENERRLSAERTKKKNPTNVR